MANTSGWTHLVRFEHKGVATFGHLVEPKEDGSLEEQFDVDVCTGDPVFDSIKRTGEIVKVAKQKLLAPFATVPLVINTGLNYKDHVTEALPMSAPDLFPPRPYIFYRPGTSIAKPFPELIRVYKVQQESLDYEGELVFQTSSRPLKDISVEQAKKEIIGFTVGCDYSPRPGKVLGRMNFIFSKAFDNWTPAGPVLVGSTVVGELPELDLKTLWNGKLVQENNSKNMIFNVAEILSAMSVGTTVQPGTVVYSGTCGGGAWFVDEGVTPCMQDGDRIDVSFSKLGKQTHYVTFDK